MTTLDNSIERRTFDAQFETREADGALALRGYAAVFDSPAHGEVVARTAFNKTLSDGADVRLLVEHEGVPLARTKSGTLRLSVDDRGLLAEADDLDPSNPDVQRITSAMRRGDIDQMSFGFRAIRESRTSDGLRSLDEVALFDVSVVTFPWYDATEVELNELDRALLAVRSGSPLTDEQVALLDGAIHTKTSDVDEASEEPRKRLRFAV